MTSQKSPAFITECNELHPSSASGKIVGLFKTGKIALIDAILSLAHSLKYI